MANGTTKVVDKGFKRIRKDLKKTDGSEVDVGILGGKVVEGTFNVAELAAVHEFGTDKAGRSRNVIIPERSFLRSTFDDKRQKYRQVLKSLMGEVLVGIKTVDQALSLFGERVVGDVKKKITDIKEPPNKPSTIARKKGKANPLIDTGLNLRARIAKRVRL